MKRLLLNTAAVITALIIVMLIASCGAPQLTAPTDLTAGEPDAENPNRVELSWLPVDKADIYYVYRSTSEKGKYEHVGHSMTSADIENSDGNEELRYLYAETFETGEGGTYWYGVTAASDIDISAESAMSSPVSAKTYEGTWRTPKLLGPAAHIRLAADTSALYALYSAAAAGSTISIGRYAADPDDESDEPSIIWTSVTSPGSSNGGNAPVSAFISGGELYTAFSDNAAGSAGSVTLRQYENTGTADAPVYSWSTLGAVGFNNAAADSISAAAVGFGGTVYTAFIEPPGTEAQLWKYHEASTAMLERATEVGVLPEDIQSVQIVGHNNNLYYGYEDNGTAGLYLRSYDDTLEELQVVNDASTVESGDIDDGNAVFVSGGGDLYAIFITDTDGTDDNGDGELKVEQLVDNVWTPLANSTGKPVADDGSAYGCVDAIWFNNALYVAYLDTDDDLRVKSYNETDGWVNVESGGGAVVQGTVTRVSLSSAGTVLYAGYVDDGNAYVTVFE